MLLCHVTNVSRTTLFAYPERLLEPPSEQQLNALLQRRLQGEPLAYLTGSREFWSLPLRVGPGVLVPRPDTELLVERAIDLASVIPAGPIVELGTGSGAIAIALSQELPDRDIIAIERHRPALDVACGNIRSQHSRVQLVQANWLDALAPACAAMIVSNPPYLAQNDQHLPSLQHEPRSALVSGETGLEDLQHIAIAARRVAMPGSVLLLEHGCLQGASVRSILADQGYQRISTDRDLAGLERITSGYLTTGV